jgi:hypothetical protein
MRDKVEHMQGEVNVLSRRCDKFGGELPVPATFESILEKENSCPISNQRGPS